jgi:hypothetical protein
MKRIITKLAIATIVVLFGNSFKSVGQVTLATTDVQIVCEGAPLTLGSPGSSNQWIVKYDATSATPSTPTTLTIDPATNQIAAADVKTGYYLITNKSTAAGACESDIQTIAVYVLPTLVPTFTSADYCTENAATTIFTASVTPTAPTGSTLVYQWYTVSGTTETIISGATSATFNPTILNTGTTSITATYRLKTAYEINSLKYCPQSIEHTVNVLPRPTTPTITVGNVGQATF